MNHRKVLVLDDFGPVHIILQRQLNGAVTVLSAYSIEQAERLFFENSDVALIAVDACVPGNVPTTTPLVRMIRKAYSGPMVALSNNPDQRQELMKAGCDHEAEKNVLYQKILDLIGADILKAGA